MRPILYLDVDGPINAFCARMPHPDRYEADVADEFTAWQTCTLRLDRRHAALLAELACDFDLVWGTAWEHAANRRISPLLGLGDLPVVEWSGVRRQYTPEHWKLPQLAAHADGRPFLWMDDECGDADNQWLSVRALPGYAMHVSPWEGITDRHVDDARGWAAALDGRPGG